MTEETALRSTCVLAEARITELRGQLEDIQVNFGSLNPLTGLPID